MRQRTPLTTHILLAIVIGPLVGAAFFAWSRSMDMGLWFALMAVFLILTFLISLAVTPTLLPLVTRWFRLESANKDGSDVGGHPHGEPAGTEHDGVSQSISLQRAPRTMPQTAAPWDPPPIVPIPSPTKSHPAYKLSIPAAAGATSGVCTLYWMIQLVSLPFPNPLGFINCFPFVFVFEVALVLPAIVAYRRVLRGPQVAAGEPYRAIQDAVGGFPSRIVYVSRHTAQHPLPFCKEGSSSAL